MSHQCLDRANGHHAPWFDAYPLMKACRACPGGLARPADRAVRRYIESTTWRRGIALHTQSVRREALPVCQVPADPR